MLIVDDDDVICEEMEEYLRACGLAACSTTSPGEALRLTRELAPELLVIDLNMPECNGRDLCALVRDLAPDAKVLLMSGDRAAVARTNRAGHDAFAVIEKPVPLRDLARFARAHFARAPR